MTTGPKERPTTPSVEQRLLDAGVALWTSEDPATIFGGLSVSSLAKAAGVTRATFYSYWPTTAEYMAALLGDLDRRRTEVYSAEVVKELSAIQSPNSDVLSRFMAASNIRLRQTVADPALRVRFGFFSKLDDPEVANGLRNLYRSYEDGVRDLNNQMSSHWGREPRPPFTEERIQALFGALLDGISLRHLIDPERMPAESFALAGAMIMMLATRPTDDPRDVMDTLGTINQWPATGVRLSTTRRVDEARSTEPLSGETLHATIYAARRMLAEDNWIALNIDDIAIAVGIDADRLLRTFGSKIGLGLAIIALNAEEQWQETTRTDDPLADLQTLLDIILFELRRSPSLGQSVIQLLAGTVRLPDRLVFTSQPVPEIARLLAEAKQQGLILDSIDPAGLSISLTRIILAEGAPATMSGVNQIDSISYILEGIRVRS